VLSFKANLQQRLTTNYINDPSPIHTPFRCKGMDAYDNPP
jgi:hypothetical protein